MAKSSFLSGVRVGPVQVGLTQVLDAAGHRYYLYVTLQVIRGGFNPFTHKR
jgi:hypothetical protein